METATLEKLEALRHYATKYEVVATHPDGRRFRVGYLGQLSRRGLFLLMRAVGERLVRVMGLDESATMQVNGSAKRPTATVGSWTVAVSGRTQRDAILSGELPLTLD